MYIKVKVTAGAKKEKVTRVSENTFEISVKEKAERNMANTRIRGILAEQYGKTVGKVKIVKGHRSAKKLFEIF